MKLQTYAIVFYVSALLVSGAREAVAMDKQEFVELGLFDKVCVDAEACLGASASACSAQMQKCLSAVPESIDDLQMEQYAAQVGSCFSEGDGLDFGRALDCKLNPETTAAKPAKLQPTNGYGYSSEVADGAGLEGSSLPSDIPYDIYPGSRFLMSIPPEPQLNIPAVVLIAPNEFDKIVAYYEQALPSWKVYREKDRVMLVSKAIPDFSLDKPSPLRLVTPHIDIKGSAKDPTTRKPAVKIQIFYNSKER